MGKDKSCIVIEDLKRIKEFIKDNILAKKEVMKENEHTIEFLKFLNEHYSDLFTKNELENLMKKNFWKRFDSFYFRELLNFSNRKLWKDLLMHCHDANLILFYKFSSSVESVDFDFKQKYIKDFLESKNEQKVKISITSKGVDFLERQEELRSMRINRNLTLIIATILALATLIDILLKIGIIKL
jgi:hypothetical protein